MRYHHEHYNRRTMDSVTWILILILCLHTLDVTDGCIGHVMTDGFRNGFLITSDGFPFRRYKSDTNRCWIITNDSGGRIRLEVIDLNTEQCCDILTVYEDVGTHSGVEVQLRPLSGDMRSERTNITSIGNVMKLTFQTDSTQTYNGWQACACPYAMPACKCRWYTRREMEDTPADEPSGSNSADENSWDYNGNSVGLIMGLTMGGFALFMALFIGLAIWWRVQTRRRLERRQGMRFSTGTPMRPVQTTNVPAGTYPVQQGVDYTALSAPSSQPNVSIGSTQQPRGDGLQRNPNVHQQCYVTAHQPDDTDPPSYSSVMTSRGSPRPHEYTT